MAARRKQEAVSIPANRAEAEALVRDYARLEHEAGHVRGIADKIIADAKASRDASLAVIDGKQAAIFAQLKGWWEATGKDEAKGKRSLVIDGTEIGLRLTTPKLGFLHKMKEADALKWLSGRAWSDPFLRTRVELDKQAIIKGLGENKGGPASNAELLSQGFKVTQKDEFFVKVAALEKPVVEGK